jgi:type IV pilus assembly protein PilY1
MYYNPDNVYKPPFKADGSRHDNADFTAAWNDGYDTNRDNCTLDLSTAFRPTWGGVEADNCNNEEDDDNKFGPEYASNVSGAAYYFKYDGAAVNANKEDDTYYTEVTVGVSEQQNFANWYSYHRKRLYAAKYALSEAFNKYGPVFRLSRQTIHIEDGISSLSVFNNTTRESFYEWIKNMNYKKMTPLRSAMINIGTIVSGSDDPYRDDPSDGTSPARSCRQNFHIMLTDGEWTEENIDGHGNYDGTDYNTISSNDYNITSYNADEGTFPYIYADNNSNYLADIAFYYWINDLRPDLANNVPINITEKTFTQSSDDSEPSIDAKTFWHPSNDPANWQHLVNYIIGFGISGNLNHPDDLTALIEGTKAGGWGKNEVDDTWHAAINSRGSYLTADNPTALNEGIDNILKAIAKKSDSSAAAVTLTSGSISSATRIFHTKFNSEFWTGDLLSHPISDGTSIAPCTSDDIIGDICSAEWSASCKLNGGYCEATGSTETGLSHGSRTIITLNPTTNTGIPFRWSNISETDQNTLNAPDSRGEHRLNYIRGDTTYESTNPCNTCTFRPRKSILGDFINSAPVYVGPPSRIYPDDLESTDKTHTAFRSSHKKRTGMVFVGGNDGMLHGFSTEDGTEKIAYIPNAVFPNLPQLTEKDYSHTSYVDGLLDEGDVFFEDTWYTMLIGGLGYGGQGIFALDVTNPNVFSESNAANIVKWEYTDVDLGYTYGKPLIRKLNNGTWAAIFGNGYNKTTGAAAIYIVDISNGTLIKKISTGLGDNTADSEYANMPNGIAGLQPIDIDQDFKIDYIYAGDLLGNMWRFNLKGTETTNWNVAFGGKPLFSAKNASNNAQPITSAPAVKRHSSLIGTMVYFGTGKYLGNSDLTDISQQTFYAIHDSWLDNETDFSASTRDDLLKQEILGTNDSQFTNTEARVTTNYPITSTHKGWYLDLNESGERIFQTPLLRNNRIIFVTATPSNDPCEAGASSWLMELDASSGSRLDTSPFDYDANGYFTSTDQVDFDVDGDDSLEQVGGSGIRIDNNGDGSGIYTTPAVANLPDSKERKYLSTSLGTIEQINETAKGRLIQSWRQVMECGI